MKKFLVNNQIRAEKVRLIDEEGKNLGIFSLEEALKMAREKNLDLIQITEKADPPVCKIGDYGKYLYQLQKKEREKKKSVSEIKGIRLTFNISEHDLETRLDQAEKFLKEGNRIRVEMILRGREKSLADFGKEKMKKFLEKLEKRIQIKIEENIKRVPSGFFMIISKK